MSSARGFGRGNKAARSNDIRTIRHTNLTYTAERPETTQRLKGAAARIAKAGKTGIMYRSAFASETLNRISTQATQMIKNAAPLSRERMKLSACHTSPISISGSHGQ